LTSSAARSYIPRMQYYIIDAFTAKPFGGNPAAVCLVDRPLEDATMAAIAREMNLSETAFVREEGRAFRLRWFTPAIEVKLCGHATLASARALREAGKAAGREVAFETLSGRLTARFDGDLIELNFPTLEARESPLLERLPEALGFSFSAVEWSGVNAHRNWLIQLSSEQIVRELKPDREKTMALPAHGIIVTARS